MHMTTPEIYCKSGIAANQIQDRLSRNADGIELQMMFDNPIADIKRQWRSEIKVVHPPLNAMGEGFHLELPFDFPASRPFHYRYLEVFNELAQREDMMLRYVLHIKQNRQILIWNGQYNELQEQLQIYTDAFQNIIFCLENTSYDLRQPYAVTGIVRDAANSRIQTCIDICHLQYALWASKLLKGGSEEAEGFEKELSIEEMFSRNRGQCGLIHLNRCGDDPRWPYGLGKNHGILFRPGSGEDMALLRDIWDMYQKYGYSCPVTIEVQEDSYDSAVNYTTSRLALQKVMVSSGKQT